ncbi:MAG: prolyl oligopeptidase family serine peptidase [Bryobacteraceae bacterium]
MSARAIRIACFGLALLRVTWGQAALHVLPGTERLTTTANLQDEMLAGIERYLVRENQRALETRRSRWRYDFSSPQSYEASVEPNRKRLRGILGLKDQRAQTSALQYVGSTASPSLIADTPEYQVHAVRWTVLPGVEGEGLLLEPKRSVSAQVVAIPDADQTPEMIAGLSSEVQPHSQFARRLAESGCRVLVPTLISRSSRWSGNPRVAMVDKPHREWVHLPAYHLGRHIIGYELHKVMAAIDWLSSKGGEIGVAGYGEGGLLAFYAAALDRRIIATLVSGYFDSRQHLHQQPVYRNVWRLLQEFGDAEIASLIAPRALIVEHSIAPEVVHNNKMSAGGRLQTPGTTSVNAEFARARALFPSDKQKLFKATLIGSSGPVELGSEDSLREFLRALKLTGPPLPHRAPVPRDTRAPFAVELRQREQTKQLDGYTQSLLTYIDAEKSEWWKSVDTSSLAKWQKTAQPLRDAYWDEIVGRLPDNPEETRPRSRKILEGSNWTGYEVTLDVRPDIFAWGYLLVPTNIPSGERRPVVVCQHGLNDVPMSVVTEDKASYGWRLYHAYAVRLAERGFVVFAPHNPYTGKFRLLQRRANPLGLSLFSFILEQHRQSLKWLSTLPYVDTNRVGFYGLSYGGRSAMIIPAMLSDYTLSISSAHFTDWTTKRVSTADRHGGNYGDQFELFDYGVGAAYNYADLAKLIAPRPFMVERGHRDDASLGTWVDSEYSKVRRFYSELGVPGRTRIEHFEGGHEIHAVGTFEFLHKYLNWPLPGKTVNHDE